LSNVISLSAGYAHVLALRDDGSVVAWGVNGAGQATNVPAGLSRVVKVAAGNSHSLALRSDGTVAGWGNGPAANVPAGLSNVVSIAAGYYHSMAIKSDGTVVAWGAGTNYVSDVSSTDKGQCLVPAGLSNTFSIAGGLSFSLVLTNESGAPSVQLANPIRDSTGFNVSLSTQFGRVYVLEYKDSLEETNWLSLPLAAGNGSMMTLTDSPATNSQRFYRVRQW
jgi:hypothetical protein